VIGNIPFLERCKELGYISVLTGWHEEAMMKKYTPKDSISARVKALLESAPIAFPPGFTIPTKVGVVLWDQYTATRDEWSEAELITVSKLVHLELRIRRESVTMDGEDVVVENRFGDVKENPRLAAIDRLIKQQASLMRLIGLNVDHDEAKRLNNRNPTGRPPKAKEESTKDRLKGKLLALPGGKK
jgi:hypothetical protein